MPLFNFKMLEICSFPHFSPSCFDILSWNFAYDFVLLYYRTSLSVVNFRQFLLELCPFWNLEYWKIHSFSALFSYTLWHIELKFCIWLCFTALQIKFQCCQFPLIFVGVMPLLERRILEIHSFPLFPLTRVDILSWNFAFDFVLLYYRLSFSVVNFRQFLLELCPFWNVETRNTQFSALFPHTLWHIELKFCIWFCFTLLQIKFECRQFPSIFVGVMPLWNVENWKIHSFSALYSYTL